MKKFVAHIIPSLDVGGVEVAIVRSHQLVNEKFDYRLFCVRRKGSLSCGQKSIWGLFAAVIFRRLRPDCVITSLWWAHPLGALLKVVGVPWVAFFHSSGYAHQVDRFVLRWAWRSASGRIVDSNATLAAMRSAPQDNAGVVPYIFPATGVTSVWESRNIDFIWVGRASSVKRMDLLVKFLEHVQGCFMTARVFIAVSGQLPVDLVNFLQTTTLDVKVEQDLGNDAVLEALDNSKFYLLFSDHEGMSMSTVEAIQAGCIPVVRRVGEISSYLRLEACVDIADDSPQSIAESVQTVYMLSKDAAAVQEKRRCAKDSFNQFGSYTPSLITAIESTFK